MAVNRRDFLKLTGSAALGGTAVALGVDLSPLEAHAKRLRTKGAKQSTSICPYCAVGCGVIVSARRGKVVNIEGDPDHPINRGSLCAKGAGLYQVANNKNRLTRPLYRAPYSDKWQVKSWDWVLNRIADRVKKTRDASFVHKNAKGQVVNRTNGIAHVGSAALDNEECWILQGMMRALGLVYIEHQARI